MRNMTEKAEVCPITVDIKKLSAMLSCGKDTAKKIGELSGARIKIGRRVLYSIPKINKYLEQATN